MAQPIERMDSYEAVEMGITTKFGDPSTNQRSVLYDNSVWCMGKDCRAATHKLKKVGCRSGVNRQRGSFA